MKRATILLWVTAFVALSAFLVVRLGLEESLHGTRAGKAYFYSEDQGGFETLTGIPMSELSCQNCHAPPLADGTPIDDATYEPSCNDCHDIAGQGGFNVPDNVCLGCHSRQGAEVTLSQNPNLAALFSDVHRDNGVECATCHPWSGGVGEFPVIHGIDNTVYNSMHEPGAAYAKCENCHTPLPSNAPHDSHGDYVSCNACHSKTVITCYNCHFETEVQANMKRYYGKPPFSGFVLLVKDAETNKVTTATLQALAYNGSTFYTIAPFHAHTIGPKEEARQCADCHNTSLVQGYVSGGEIPVVQWDAGEGKLVNTKGVIPVPPDWQAALKFDFVNYLGDVTDPFEALDPADWEFLKSGPDLTQMLFASPLDADQMNKLAANVVGIEDEAEVPSEYVLSQNFPNPFNPSTSIRFALPVAGQVTLTVFDAVGREVATIVNGNKTAGWHTVEWNAEQLSSGLYVYRLESGDFGESKTMMLLK